MNSYEVYCFYLAIKRHFTDENYDFIKYNGKVKTSIPGFEKRKDKYCFQKIRKHRNPKGYIMANIIDDPNKWVGEFSNDIFIDWEKRTQSLLYLYRQDIEKIDDPKKWLTNISGMPQLFNEHASGNIMIETMVILDMLTNFSKNWDSYQEMNHNPLWPIQKLCIKKYAVFLKRNINLDIYNTETKNILSVK